MARASREIWIKRIERWRDSGLDAKEFAEQVGVEVDRLRHWKGRLAKEDRATNAASAESTPLARFPFVEVKTTPAQEGFDAIIEVVAPSGAAGAGAGDAPVGAAPAAGARRDRCRFG